MISWSSVTRQEKTEPTISLAGTLTGTIRYAIISLRADCFVDTAYIHCDRREPVAGVIVNVTLLKVDSE